MFEIKVGGTARKAEVSFLTAQIYEAEFQADIIKEFFGKADLAAPEPGDDSVSVDFTRINWTAALKALWAAIKTADPATPGYRVWAKDAAGVNMWLAAQQLSYELADCFFRSEPAGEDEEERGR